MIGGISPSLASEVKYINVLFIKSLAFYLYDSIDPKVGMYGSYLNSRSTSKIPIVILLANKLANKTPISKALRLAVCPVNSKNISAGEIVLVAAPKSEAEPTTANSPSCVIMSISKKSPIELHVIAKSLPITDPMANSGRKIPLGHGSERESTENINLRMTYQIRLNPTAGVFHKTVSF
jgi:hypothetical protein